MSFKFICQSHIFLFVLIANISEINGFVNIFGELFSDLKFGSFGSNLLNQAKVDKKLKCMKGSFSFNGTCYFLSDTKYSDNYQNEILEKLEAIKDKIEVSSIKFNQDDRDKIPRRASWENAKSYCNQLEIHSSLIQFNEQNFEFEYIKNLLKFTNDDYNDSSYRWINDGTYFNNSEFKNILKEGNSYRSCAYLNIRDDQSITIEWDNCKNVDSPFICKYVYDRCINNSYCGKNGGCVNLHHTKTIECRCRIFYEGSRCEKWSNQGIQMIIAIGIIFGILLFSKINTIRLKVWRIRIKNKNEGRTQRSKSELIQTLIYKTRISTMESNENIFTIIFKMINNKRKLFIITILSFIASLILLFGISFTRYKIIKNRIQNYHDSNDTEPEKSIDKDHISDMTVFFSIDICTVINSEFLEDFILIILSIILTLLIYLWNMLNDKEMRKTEIPVPINPFSKKNRFLTCIIYTAYTYNILKIFEHVIIGDNISDGLDQGKKLIKENFNFTRTTNLTLIKNQINYTINSASQSFRHGILVGLLKQVLVVIMIGLRYYPVLLCINLKRKSKFSYFLCTLYVLFLLVYYVYMNTFCLLSAYSTIKQAYDAIKREKSLNSVLDNIKLPQIFRLQSDNLEKQNLTKIISDNLFLKNFMIEKFLFYTILCLITIYMLVEFFSLIIFKKRIEYRESIRFIDETNYLKELLRKPKRIPYTKYLFDTYIYKNRKYFRYSKEFINTNLIAFVLLYYITCLIIRKSSLLVSLSNDFFVFAVSFVLKLASNDDLEYMMPTKDQVNRLIINLHNNINVYVIIACCSTTIIYIVQLLIGIKRYQKHVTDGYKGIYEDIPPPKRIPNVDIAVSSLHYSGYAIGYLIWGYFILFQISIGVILILKILIQFYFVAENLAKIILPIITIYLLKRIIIWYVCNNIVAKTNTLNKRIILKSPKFYYILGHFNFFFDCFLGSFICLIRMAKSSLASLFFMPRLDYSIFGRFLENKDMGFTSYVSFIHMEINQTHPIKLAFCDLLKQAIELDSRMSKKSKSLRNKWYLCYTLLRNPNLILYKKNYASKKLNKFETRSEFFERIFCQMFDMNDKALMDFIKDLRKIENKPTIDYLPVKILDQKFPEDIILLNNEQN